MHTYLYYFRLSLSHNRPIVCSTHQWFDPWLTVVGNLSLPRRRHWRQAQRPGVILRDLLLREQVQPSAEVVGIHGGHSRRGAAGDAVRGPRLFRTAGRTAGVVACPRHRRHTLSGARGNLGRKRRRVDTHSLRRTRHLRKTVPHQQNHNRACCKHQWPRQCIFQDFEFEGRQQILGGSISIR